MSVLFQTGKLCLYRKCLKTSFSKYVFIRKASDVCKPFISFDEIVAQRRAQARRSLVVQVNSESSFNELYGYCSKYASIEDVYHYKNSTEEHFMLIEFSTEENVKEILRSCTAFQKDVDAVGVQSPFLWFRAASGKEKYQLTTKTLAIKDGLDEVDEDVLYKELLECDTVSDQIQHLYERTKLNDLGIRLRYMVARQLEVIFSSLYANVAIHAFGSSVNGFGKMGCDLDLVLTNTLTSEMTTDKNRLVYQERRCDGASVGARTPAQRHVELAAAAVELRAAGAARVQRVLHARVPIVKYEHRVAAVHCDLCYNNTSGVYMSELMWQLGALSARARPLAVAVRRWARAAALTHAHPGRWLANFPLTLMALFAMQRRGCLPAVNTLVEHARKEDIRIAEDNLNCTFLRDMNLLPASSYGQCDDNLETLLMQFFEFYAQFDFQDKAISINEGAPVRKPNSLPLYIVNPLEQSLNVSRNVSYEELERLKLEVRNAAWQLESGLEGKKGEDWGILGLLEKPSSRGLKKLLRVGNSHRLVSVKDLFNDNEVSEPAGTIKSKLERLTKAEKTDGGKETKEKETQEKETQSVKFKNPQVRNEVNRIRRGKIV